jgi:acyl-CoA thioesterase YciA
MRKRSPEPRGVLSLRTIAMRADANPVDEMFVGWVMYLMDLAVGAAVAPQAKGHVATASVSNLRFVQTVRVGDVVCVYTDITKTGQTSIAVDVEVYVLRQGQGDLIRVTAAEFVVVAVDDHRMPRLLTAAA